MAQSIRLVEYLFKRLHQLGVRAVHGVPGDYNLVALDYIEPAGLKWVGDANELNAGYAADGYARVKGIGAVVTTFGVGELSAINAIAGAFAEYVPVVHMVGTPSTLSQQGGMLLHHTLGNGDFRVFADMYKSVTVAQANLSDPNTAPQEIDAVLKECWIKSRPVYVQLPTDMVTRKVDPSGLASPIDLSYPQNDEEVEAYTTGEILEEFYQAKRPLLLVDGCVTRHRMVPEVDALVRKSGLPTFVSPMGKGAVNETYSNFAGVYAGDGSYDSVREFVEQSDLVLTIGPIKSDFNTTGFTYRISQLKSIDLHTDFVVIGFARYQLHMRGVVSRLATELDPSKLSITPFKGSETRTLPDHLRAEYSPTTITQDYLWPKLSDWLRPGDILLTETGTAYLGIWDTKFPPDTTAISQTLWGSIGYTLPAAQGAAAAAKELGKKQRVILFEGDGSFHLTAQSVSTMIDNELDIIIILINNEGYTIERWVHGMEASYNDVPTWKYTDVPFTFGATKATATSCIVETRAELEKLWETDEFRHGTGMRFVEMRMPKEDAPVTLKMVCAAAAKANAKQ